MLKTLRGIRLRPPTASDARALSELFAKSWREAYTAIIPDQHLAMMIQARSVVWWKRAAGVRRNLIIIEVGGVVAGYGSFGRARGGNRQLGEITELYLLPTHQGIGLGEVLFEACRAKLDCQDFRGLVVWALADNSRAIAFYQRRGGRICGRSQEMIGGASLAKIGFRWD